MTKEEIANKHYWKAKQDGYDPFQASLLAMDDYAKQVLRWVLDASEDGIGGNADQRIEMIGRAFWYEDDKEGDFEIGAEEIIKLYENANK